MSFDAAKYRKIERYLNRLKMNEIKIGSLLGQALEFDYYSHAKHSYKNVFRIFKYLLLLFITKNERPNYSKLIFTKLINRYHFNELIDPLISHYQDQSSIVCSQNSSDNFLFKSHSIGKPLIDFNKTINNTSGDILSIWSTFLKATWILVKNKKRLEISSEQLIFFLSQLIVQLRRVSFWDLYFSKAINKPKCVITEFDRNSISSVIVSCAKKHKIMTITLTHGVICDFGFTPLLADYIFCWGKSQRIQLIEQGVASNRIFITGNPMIKGFGDRISTSIQFNKICLALSPDFISPVMIESFVSALDKFRSITGIIKLHPSQYKEDFKWVNDLSSKILIKSSEEISNNELFKEIDLLVVHQSGIANEALCFGIPVIIFEPAGLVNFSQIQRELVEVAGCKAAVHSEELTAIFGEFLSDPQLYRYRSKEPHKRYLNNLYDSIGEDSVKSMISRINSLTEI